jgi:hypothetical protein
MQSMAIYIDVFCDFFSFDHISLLILQPLLAIWYNAILYIIVSQKIMRH